MSRTWKCVIAVVALGTLAACGPGGQGASAPVVQETTTAGAATEQAAGATDAGLSCTPGSGREFASSAPMNLTDLGNAQLDCAVFDHQTMNAVKLSGAHLSGARFQNSTINRVDFRDAVLRGAEFSSDTLNTVDFRDADLTGADLRDAHMNTVDWKGATCPDATTSASANGCAEHMTPKALSAGAAPTSAGSGDSGDAGDAGVQAAPSAFDTAAHGTYRCTGSTVMVNGASSDLHLTGSCGTVVVNGASSDVEVDSAEKILVNGAKADVVYHGSPVVSVDGVGATAHRG